MGQIPVSDVTLLTPTDYSKVRMELFEKLGTGLYKVRYEAAQTFLQLAADIVIGGASAPFDTLGKIEPMITALQAAGAEASSVEFDVDNQTDAIITRGTVVYPDVTTIIGLADAYNRDKCRLIAVVKEDIPIGGSGKVVRIGQVFNVNTTGFVPGQLVYLDKSGAYVPTLPTGGGYICIVGVVDVVSATAGVITVDTHVSTNTVEVTDTNGFPTAQRDNTTLSYVEGTRTLTITPDVDDFHYYQAGAKYIKTAAVSLAHTNVTGAHIFYFDGATVSVLANPTGAQISDIILNKVILAFVYWNATTAKGVIIQDERHGLMQPVVHSYMHRRFGAFYIDGLALENVVIDNGSLDAHAQFGTALGEIQDEDLRHNLLAVPSTTGLKILYREGTTGAFNLTSKAGFNFTVGATPLPQYNFFNGTTWALAEVPSGSFFNLHVFANGSIDRTPFSVVGTAAYSTATLASSGQANELSTILGSLPLPEFVLLASVIIECKTVFANSVNARVVLNDEGLPYTNWTETELAAGSTPSNHDALAGLKTAGVGVQWGHVDDALYTKILNNSALNKLDGAVAPAVSNDNTQGYSVFSFWLDLVLAKAYVCMDATTGAAVWVDITAEGGGGGGGHIIQENAVSVTTARAKLNFVTANSEDLVTDNAGNDSTDYTPTIKGMNDLDATGRAAGDVIQTNATNDGHEYGQTAPDDKILPVSIEPNISADSVTPMSVIIPAGYKIASITVQETAAAAAGNISIGTAASGTQIVNAFTVGASADAIMPLVADYFSSVNDTDMYVSSSVWGTGVIQLNFVFQKTI